MGARPVALPPGFELIDDAPKKPGPAAPLPAGFELLPEAASPAADAKLEAPRWRHPYAQLGDRIVESFREGAIGTGLGLNRPAPTDPYRPATERSLFAASNLATEEGVGKGLANFSEGMLTPVNLMILTATGGIGTLSRQAATAALPKAISAGFTYDMLKSYFERSPEFIQAFQEGLETGDFGRAKTLGTELALTGAMAAGATKHVLSREPVQFPASMAPKPGAKPTYSERAAMMNSAELADALSSGGLEPGLKVFVQREIGRRMRGGVWDVEKAEGGTAGPRELRALAPAALPEGFELVEPAAPRQAGPAATESPRVTSPPPAAAPVEEVRRDARASGDVEGRGVPVPALPGAAGEQLPRVLDEPGVRPLRTDDRGPAAPAAQAAALSGKSGRQQRVYTPKETAADVEYVLADARQLRNSFDQGYDQDLQPRNTDRTDSRARIEEMKSRLNPEKLGESVNAGDGAPIVVGDLEVLTGNHRTQALRELYQQGGEKATAYRSWLEENAPKFGLKPEDVAATEQPVLVRRLVTPMDKARLVEFAEEGNMASTARMSDAEQAQVLARRITGPVMESFNPREDGTPNYEFVQALLKDLPPQERSNFMDARGELSQSGVRAIRNAVFAKAYPDTAALERLAEATDSNVRNISNGMLAAAPRVARLEELVKSGDRHDLSVAAEASRAAEVLSSLKDQGLTVEQWLAQEHLFGRDAVVDRLVETFAENRRSAKRIGEVIREYTELVDRLGSPKQTAMFAEAGQLSRQELLDVAIENVRERFAAERAAGKTGELFSDPARDGGEAQGIPPQAGKIGRPVVRRETERGSFSLRPPKQREAELAESSGAAPAEPKKAPAATGEADPAAASPSYDRTKRTLLAKLSEGAQEPMRKALADFEARNPERRTVTFQEIIGEGRRLGLVGVMDLKAPKAGETLDPAVRFAAREAIPALREKIGKLDEQLRGELPEAKRKELAEQREAIEQDARRLTDILVKTRSQDGRNLAYHRIMAEAAPFDDAYWLARAKRAIGLPPEADIPADVYRDVTGILDKGRQAEGRHKGLRERLKSRGLQAKGFEDVRQIEIPEVTEARIELAKKMAELERTGPLDTFVTLVRAGLLTGPRTHEVNLTSNAAFQMSEELARIPAAVVDVGRSIFTGSPRQVQGPSLAAWRRARKAVFERFPQEAGEIWRQGARNEDLIKGEVRKELNTGNPKLDRAVNSVFRSLAIEDRVFKIAAYERALYEQAWLKVTAEGVIGRTRKARIADLLEKPSGEMIAEALYQADWLTFNNRNVGAEAFGVAKGYIAGKNKLAAAALDLTVPFVRTPANVFARIIDYTPAGVAVAGGKATWSTIKGNFDAKQQRALTMAIGRGAVGAALMYIGWKGYQDGWITPGWNPDAGARNTDEAAGRIAGSMRIGDRWHQISRLAPGGAVLALGATLARESSKSIRDEGLRLDKQLKAAGQVLLEQPMVRGTKDLVEALTGGEAELKQLVSSKAGMLVPTIVADAAALLDDYRRDSRPSGALDAMAKGVQARLPGLRNRLPARVDVLGRKLEQDPVAAVYGGIGAKDRTLEDPVAKALVTEQVRVGKLQRQPGETADEARARAEATGRLMRGVLVELIGSLAYQAADRGERSEAIRRAISTTRGQVTREIVKDERYRAMKSGERIEMWGRIAKGAR